MYAELVQIIHELGMQQAMFNLNTRRLDDEWLMTGMQDLVLGTTPSATFGSLVAIPAPYVGKCIHEVTTTMAALGDIEGKCHEGGGKNVD